MLSDLIRKNRSYRRFYQNEPVAEETLRELVDLARLSATASNLQPLRFLLSHTAEKNAKIFETLGWAGYLKDWKGPEEGERPSAYVVILKDQSINAGHTVDEGITAQSILLGAVEKGLGGCMLGNVDRRKLSAALSIGEPYEISLVIALGRPKEEVVIEPIGPDGDVRYWRDDFGVHHVPKRSLEDLVL